MKRAAGGASDNANSTLQEEQDPQVASGAKRSVSH